MQQNIVYEDRTMGQSVVARFMYATYLWMGVGLFVTGLVAMLVASSSTLLSLFYYNRVLLFGVMIAELVLVFYLASRITKMEYSKARNLFLLYAALNGVSMAVSLRSIDCLGFFRQGQCVYTATSPKPTSPDLATLNRRLGGDMFVASSMV